MVFYEAFDFQFLKQVKFSFVEKLENLGCISLFNIGVEVYTQLVCLFYGNVGKLKPQKWRKTYYNTKVKDHVITLTTASIERIFHLIVDPSKFRPSMLASKT